MKDRLCLECDSQGCTKCSAGFFISNGVCTSCEMIVGCRPGFCSSNKGCTECSIGYYLDDGMCKSCSSAISGCSQCRSSDVCTQCASQFLTINQGKCVCRAGSPNQYTDPDTGACLCNSGFYMTSSGCLTCNYLIPGCSSCNIT